MLNESQLREFERDGCLVVPGVVDPDTLRRIRDQYARRAEDLLRRMTSAGRLPDKPVGNFDENVSRLICEAPGDYERLDISLPMDPDMAARIPAWRRIFGDQWRDEAGLFAGEIPAVFNQRWLKYQDAPLCA